MAYAKKTNYSSSRPSQGGAASNNAAVEKDPATQTTHYGKRKTENGSEYVDGMFIWENEGEFGTYLKISVTEPLQPGIIYVSRKKAQ